MAAHSHAAADAHEERVAIDVQQRGRVVNPDWRRVYREPVGDHSRNDHAQRGRIAFLEVVRTFHRDESRERHRDRIALPHGVVLAVELEGLVDRRAIDSGLQMPRDAKPVLEADRRSLIEPEQIAGILAEAALPKIAVEPVRELEARSVAREPQRGRQVENAEIRLREHQLRIVVIARPSRPTGSRVGFATGPQVDCASCAAAADVNTVSSAAAEKTIERWVMTNMSCCSPLICVYVPGVTINQAFMRL